MRGVYICIAVVAILALTATYFRYCNMPKEIKEITTTESDTTDTPKIHTGTTTQGTKGKDSLIYITIYQDRIDTLLLAVDTAKILREYFAKRIYTNHYKDSLLEETIIDTVSENKITGRLRTYTITYNERTITNTITQTKSATGFYLGGELGLNDAGPGVMYLRKRMAYNVDYQIKREELKIGAYYKLFR